MHAQRFAPTAEHHDDLPEPRPPRFRRVVTEIQREKITGGWETIAVAEDPDWAGTITAALNWLEYSPVFSETA